MTTIGFTSIKIGGEFTTTAVFIVESGTFFPDVTGVLSGVSNCCAVNGALVCATTLSVLAMIRVSPRAIVSLYKRLWGWYGMEIGLPTCDVSQRPHTVPFREVKKWKSSVSVQLVKSITVLLQWVQCLPFPEGVISSQFSVQAFGTSMVIGCGLVTGGVSTKT